MGSRDWSRSRMGELLVELMTENWWIDRPRLNRTYYKSSHPWPRLVVIIINFCTKKKKFCLNTTYITPTHTNHTNIEEHFFFSCIQLCCIRLEMALFANTTNEIQHRHIMSVIHDWIIKNYNSISFVVQFNYQLSFFSSFFLLFFRLSLWQTENILLHFLDCSAMLFALTQL